MQAGSLDESGAVIEITKPEIRVACEREGNNLSHAALP